MKQLQRRKRERSQPKEEEATKLKANNQNEEADKIFAEINQDENVAEPLIGIDEKNRKQILDSIHQQYASMQSLIQI